MQKIGLSVTETASTIGLGLTKTWELVRSGQLPVRRIGRRTIVRVADVEAFLKSTAPSHNGREA
jgi:excisionase family DNA binding protein